MKTKTVFLFGLALAAGILSAHGQITLEECYEKARANYPLIRRYDLIDRAQSYSLANVSKAWLPQIGLAAKATYQSDVTEIPIDFAALGIPVQIPALNKDQYGATLEISQMLFDGGATGAKRKTVRSKSAAERQEVEVELYTVRERVNQLFFGILLCDAMLQQNRLFQNELATNGERVEKLINGGLANQTDLDAVKVELLKAQQSAINIAYGRKVFVEMLAAFIGEKLSPETVLQRPVEPPTVSLLNRRPELSLFDANLASLDAAKSEINAALLPRVGIFLTGGYGNPGLNMLRNEFSAYYVGGIRLSWSFGGLYTRRNSLRLLETTRTDIALRRETFLFHTALSQTGEEADIARYRELLRSDDQIIALRNAVKCAAEARVENGTMTVTDLLHETNAEQLARQEKIVHELELLQAVYKLKYLTNT